jgi:hypothetical protein
LRLYVRTVAGADLGWWDLTTDEGHALDPQLAPDLAAGYAAPVRTVVEASADLLSNRAGEALMRREVAELAAVRLSGRRVRRLAPRRRHTCRSGRSDSSCP